jgi:hypothetical protein
MWRLCKSALAALGLVVALALPANAAPPTYYGNVVGEFHTSGYGVCATGDRTANLQAAYTAASAFVALSPSYGAKVVFDCATSVSGPINVGTNTITDGRNAQLTETSATGNLFVTPANTAYVRFNNLNLMYSHVGTAGGTFVLKSCYGCSMDHVSINGLAGNDGPFDLLDLATTANNVEQSRFTDVSVASGAINGAAFRLLGTVQGTVLCDKCTLYGPTPSGSSVGLEADDSVVGFDPNWDVLWLTDTDLEAFNKAVDIKMTYGIINDVFFTNLICDTFVTGTGCLYMNVAAPAGQIRRVRIINPWFSGQSSLTASTANWLYDIQFLGGHMSAGSTLVALTIGFGVNSIDVKGTQCYNSLVCIDDFGTNLTASGMSVLGAPVYYAVAVGIALESTSAASTIIGNNLKGATYAIQTNTGANGAVISGNDWTGAGTQFSGGTNIYVFGNAGYAPMLNGITCYDTFATIGGPQKCADPAGNFTVAGAMIAPAAASSSSCTHGFTNGSVTWYAAAGAPTCSAADGSLYTNTTPGAAVSLYARTNGAWVAK